MANYPSTPVAYGQTSDAVKQLQTFLISQNIPIQAGATGYFGEQTKAALAKWQASQGITGAGVGTNWGPQSIAKANVTPATVNPNQTKIDEVAAKISEIQKQADAMQRLGITNTDQMTIDASGNYVPVIDPNNPKDTTGTPPADNPMRPELIPGTPEYQAAWDKISTAYYDVMQTALTADTDAQQAAAQTSWDQLRNYTAATLGVNLSADATKAWDQITGLKNQSGSNEQNITGSGMQQESIDTYLKSIRAADKANRLTSQNTQDSSQAKYYQGFASPAQVKALVDSNPTLAASYGLIPSDDIKNKMSYAALKAKYPDMKDEDINAQRAIILDENGNLRSTLWQKRETGSSYGVDVAQETPMYSKYDENGKGIGSIIGYNVAPGDMGMMDIAQARKQFQNRNAPLGNAAEMSGASILTHGPGSAIGTGANNTTPAPVTPAATTPAPVVVPPGLTTTGTSGNTNNTNLPSVNNNENSTQLVPGQLTPYQQSQVSSMANTVSGLKDQLSKYMKTMSGIK